MKEIVITLKSGEQITIKAAFSPLGNDGGPNAAAKREMATRLVYNLIVKHIPAEAFQTLPRLEVGRL